MSITENVDLLAGRIAQEFNNVQTQISALSAGGGGGGGVGAPSYHGQFNLTRSMSSIPANAVTATTGPTINVSTVWIDAFASPDNVGFEFTTSPFTFNGIETQRNNGGVKFLNAGKYRVHVFAQISAPNMQSGISLNSIVTRNNVAILQGNQFNNFEITSAGSSTSHANFLRHEFSGIVSFAADDVMCFGIKLSGQEINSPNLRYTFSIESLF